MSSCENPQVDGEALMQGRPKFDKSTNCIKCKERRGNITIRHAVYCKSCFLPLVIAKFRRCLDPHINDSQDGSRRSALKASGDLLVGFSGGLGSTVLLEILERTYFPSDAGSSRWNGKGGKAHPRNRSVWGKAYACYVDLNGAFPEESARDRTAGVREAVKRWNNFDLIEAKLEEAFDRNWWRKVSGSDGLRGGRLNLLVEDLPFLYSNFNYEDASPGELLRSYLSSLPTPSAVQAAILTLIRIILVYTAYHLECSHLALGTCLTSLSISLITSIAQGGGYNIPDEVFEEWRVYGQHNADSSAQQEGYLGNRSVRIVKPLRDVGMKECSAWAWWQNLHVVGKTRMPLINPKQTIGGLTKNFVVGLERDYPSTVSTIVRTCSKVAPKDTADDRCALCQRPSAGGVLDWKARISIRTVSQGDDSGHGQIEGRSEGKSFAPRLCYACHTHLTSKSSRTAQAPTVSAVPLPTWTESRMIGEESSNGEIWKTTPLSDEGMKRSIGEFLLEE